MAEGALSNSYKQSRVRTAINSAQIIFLVNIFTNT